MGKDIFISYKSEDYIQACFVRDGLAREGISVWMAPESIAGGKSYASEIPPAIRNCKVFVLILSAKAQTSIWVPKELDQAINDGKEVMPFMVENCSLNEDFNFYLRNVQRYPAYENMGGVLQQMIYDIKKVIGEPVEAEEKTEERPQVKQLSTEPEKLLGLRFRDEAQKIRFAFNEGKKLYHAENADSVQRNEGLSLMNWAANKGNPDAWYELGVLLLNHRIKVPGKEHADAGMYNLYRAAQNGHENAKGIMETYCNMRYKNAFKEELKLQPPAPLRDFDGWRIKINHTNKLLPVTAKLEFDGEQNILTLGVTVMFLDDSEEAVDPEMFHKAVIDGIKDWEGIYTVFGGQKLTVLVDVYESYRVVGVVNIAAIKGSATRKAVKLINFMGSDKKRYADENIVHNQSDSGIGLKKWSVKSQKNIFIQNRNGRFDNYEEIKRAVRHEFGHVLGLGEAFKSEGSTYPGIAKGTYRDLDPYYIDDKRYNLVMHDNYGMISNNDIEMVVLAFAENAMQNYQPNPFGLPVSKALGRGN